jgi:acyl-CoA reductase-like NAD-dependent aldehyde dehydrogenase
MTETSYPPGGHFIGGQWLFEGDPAPSIDPATGAVIASYHKGSEALADAAIDAAWNDRSCLHLIHAKLIENDASSTLKRLAERLGQRV